MSQLTRIVNRRMWDEATESRERQELGAAVHKAWALRLASIYARYIRLWESAEYWRQTGLLMPEPSKAWMLAAYTLLSFGTTEARHVFLTGDQATKDRLVDAVIADDGVGDDWGHWMDLLT